MSQSYPIDADLTVTVHDDGHVSQSYPIDADLTVTVHDDGHVTWSSSYTITRGGVERIICAAMMHANRRLAQLRELSERMRAAEEAHNLTAEEVLSELKASHPAPLPALRATECIGVVYLEVRQPMSPHDSSPYMATIASALTVRGYDCTRSRTRVTVRLSEQQKSAKHTK